MFYTGRRSIFDVCQGHIGHSIEMLPVEEEGVVKGIKVYCRTCSEPLIIQETEDWSVREEIERRKAARLNAMSYDEWECGFYRELQEEHDAECDCGEMDGCEFSPQYESTELSQFYNEYLDSLQPQRQTRAPSARLWDVNESDCWET